MADISFIHKNTRGQMAGGIQPLPPPLIPAKIDGLQGSMLKSHVAGQSFKVIKASTTVAYGINSNVAGWMVEGNLVQVVGPNPLTLNFINPAEAQIAEPRLAAIINGHIVS